ncbi:hypothetical protein D3C73_1027630 [compost metagenome]
MHNTGRATGRQFPVGREGGGGDRHVVGVAFHAHAVGHVAQHAGQAGQGVARMHVQRCRAGRKQDVAVDLDFDPQFGAAHADHAAVDQGCQRSGQAVGDAVELPLGTRDLLLVVHRHRHAHLRGHRRQQGGVVRWRGSGWPDLGAGLDHRRAVPATALHLLVADLDRVDGARRTTEGIGEGVGHDPVLALVDRGDRVHDHEEGEQQRHQVGIGDGPCFVIGVLFVVLAAGHVSAGSRRGWFRCCAGSRPGRSRSGLR